MALFTGETAALLDRVYLLLKIERTLLEAAELDWERLEKNLKGIEELFASIARSWQPPAGSGEARPVPVQQFNEVIARRRENLELMQIKAREWGRRLVSFRQEKAALLAYTAGAGTTALPRNSP